MFPGAGVIAAHPIASPIWGRVTLVVPVFDAASTLAATMTDTPTWSHANNGNLLSVAFLQHQDYAPMSGVTYDGIAMSHIQTIFGSVFSGGMELWQLTASDGLTIGTHDIVGSGSFAQYSGMAVSHSNANQTTSYEGLVTSTGTSSPVTVDCTSITDACLIVDFVFAEPNSISPGAGQTSRVNFDDGASFFLGISEEGPISPAALTTMSWTALSVDDYGSVALAIRPVGATSVYDLTINSIQSLSQNSQPSLTVAFQLVSESIQSSSQLSQPSISADIFLTIDSEQASSQLEQLTFTVNISLDLLNSIECQSQLSQTAIYCILVLPIDSTECHSQNQQTDVEVVGELSLNSIEALSQLSEPSITCLFVLTINSEESTSQLNQPNVTITGGGTTYDLTIDSIQSPAQLEQPLLTCIIELVLESIQSISQMSRPNISLPAINISNKLFMQHGLIPNDLFLGS